MGHVQKRGDRKYQARWIDDQDRERAQTFTRKVDAERHLAKVEGDKLQGTYVDRSNAITVSEYAKQWAATRPHRASTAKRTESLISTQIEGTALGSRRLVAVRPSEVQAWATDRAQRLAPSTLRLVVKTLRSVFNAAVGDRLVASSPVQRLSLPRAERERIVPLTVAQVKALAGAMPPRCKAMVIAQAGLGLRVGELLALRIEDVDFLRRTGFHGAMKTMAPASLLQQSTGLICLVPPPMTFGTTMRRCCWLPGNRWLRWRSVSAMRTRHSCSPHMGTYCPTARTVRAARSKTRGSVTDQGRTEVMPLRLSA